MWFKRLASLGILGINQRNANYTLLANPRKNYPLADDKLLTKELAILNGINVPELYGLIRHHHELSTVLAIADKHPHFVVKPSMGSEGEGILVLTVCDSGFERPNGQIISSEDLMHYLSGILSGLHSLGGQDDKALVEYKVEVAPVFEHVAYRGVPDVRIIVYRGVPVMSMMRLPTRESNGKANLHQGAIGVGIDLTRGVSTHGVHHNRIITAHPDTNQPIHGITIPYWHTMLDIAARCHDMTKLGYLGVDVVIDKTLGPMILEINARPGLSIQVANQAGLSFRLEAVDRNLRHTLTLDERIRLGQEIADQCTHTAIEACRQTTQAARP